jgi:uncharacterized damage-inducible protein DinB
MKETLVKFAGYNQWANDKLITLLIQKAPELIEKEIGSSYATIKQTFLHMADAELIWHARLTDADFPDLPSKAGKPITFLKEADQLLTDFLSSKSEDYFIQATSYKNLKGDAFTNMNNAILMHIFNHATFHRGQVVSMLRNAGYKGQIESTDFISFERS